MPFPPVPRVVYRRAPLAQVICQLRFPAILRIDTEPPAGFQDRVRAEFPNFTETNEIRIPVPMPTGDQIPADVIRQALQSSFTKNYALSSIDGSWRINLARNFIALTTTSYQRWEDFARRLAKPFQALNETYAPPHFTRVGLRYVDVIKRSSLGLSDVPWRDLLSPAITGMLGVAETADSIDSFESVHELRLSVERGKARIVVNLIREDEEVKFRIDSDFFETSRTEQGAVFELLDYLHSYASRLLRWAIKTQLHEAMEPTPL